MPTYTEFNLQWYSYGWKVVLLHFSLFRFPFQPIIFDQFTFIMLCEDYHLTIQHPTIYATFEIPREGKRMQAQRRQRCKLSWHGLLETRPYGARATKDAFSHSKDYRRWIFTGQELREMRFHTARTIEDASLRSTGYKRCAFTRHRL